MYVYSIYLLYNLVVRNVRRYIVTIWSQINSQSIYEIVDSSTNVYITYIYIYICKTYDLGCAHQVRVTLWRLNFFVCDWLVVSSGRWSSLSSFLQTPAAPPHSPVNTGGGHIITGLGQLLIQVAFTKRLGQDHIQT